MNFDAIIKKGSLPWRPNTATSELEVWDGYEIPTSGTFAFDSGTVLFTLVGDIDPSAKVSIWGYTELPDSVPDEFSSEYDLRSWVEQQFVGVPAIYAQAKDLKISKYSEKLVRNSVYGGAAVFLRNVIDQLEKQRESSSQIDFFALQADVETRSELQDA